MKSLPVPISIIETLTNPAAIKIDKPVGTIPDDADTLLLDVDVELVCGDLVMVVYKSEPSLYYVRRLGMAMCERKYWRANGGNAITCATFESRTDPDLLGPVSIDKIEDLQKIAYWRDASGEYHSAQTPARK